MLNKAQLIGRVGMDPETRTFSNGESVTNFTLATNKKWKDKQSGEMVEAVEWHRISMFGKLSEIASEYVKKGSLIYVEGEIQTRKFTDKNGVEKSSTDIRGNELRLLSTKSDGQTAAQKPASQASNDFDQEVPF